MTTCIHATTTYISAEII